MLENWNFLYLKITICKYLAAIFLHPYTYTCILFAFPLQVFQHTHGLFISDEVISLIVFNAGKSLYETVDHRYTNDITPSKSGIKSICYWMEVVSARVSRESTSKDDFSKLHPTYVLVATHIDELHEDITVARKIAFEKNSPCSVERIRRKTILKSHCRVKK